MDETLNPPYFCEQQTTTHPTVRRRRWKIEKLFSCVSLIARRKKAQSAVNERISVSRQESFCALVVKLVIANIFYRDVILTKYTSATKKNLKASCRSRQMYKKARAPLGAIIMSKKAADNRIFLSLIQIIKRLTTDNRLSR